MLLAAALANAAFAAGRVLVVVFLSLTIAIGGWLTGQWMTGGVGPDSVHPGYFLPPAAAGYAIAVIALLTAFVSWIAFRTVVLAVRGQLFPARRRGRLAIT
jgi:hypothetical protein